MPNAVIATLDGTVIKCTDTLTHIKMMSITVVFDKERVPEALNRCDQNILYSIFRQSDSSLAELFEARSEITEEHFSKDQLYTLLNELSE